MLKLSQVIGTDFHSSPVERRSTISKALPECALLEIASSSIRRNSATRAIVTFAQALPERQTEEGTPLVRSVVGISVAEDSKFVAVGCRVDCTVGSWTLDWRRGVAAELEALDCCGAGCADQECKAAQGCGEGCQADHRE